MYILSTYRYGGPSESGQGTRELMSIESTNVDREGKKFVSTIENRGEGVFGVQWHPEANAHDRDHETVNHSPAAVEAMAFLARTFVNLARQSGAGTGDVDGSNDIEDFPFIDGRYVFQP